MRRATGTIAPISPIRRGITTRYSGQVIVTASKKSCVSASPRKTGPSSAQSEFSALDGPIRSICKTAAEARKAARAAAPFKPLSLVVSGGEGKKTHLSRSSRSRLVMFPAEHRGNPSHLAFGHRPAPHREAGAASAASRSRSGRALLAEVGGAGEGAVEARPGLARRQLALEAVEAAEAAAEVVDHVDEDGLAGGGDDG